MIKHNPFNRYLPWIIIPISLSFFGLIAVLLGKELSWDLANYHYYNPYAWLHHRTDHDFLPTSFVHQFLNPLLDIFTYFLINHYSAWCMEFILGTIHGVNFFWLFLIARALKVPTILSILLSLIGIYGPTALPGLGSVQNDNVIANFVLLFVWLEIRLLQSPQQAWYGFRQCLVSIILGLGIGLKLTGAIYSVGALLSLLFLPRNLRRFKCVMVCSIGIIIGVLCSGGFWFWSLWTHYGNPIFPFFNNIFHAKEFAYINWQDTRFLPKTLWQYIFFPFYFSWDGRTSDVPFQDVRFLLLYLCFMIYGIQLITLRWAKKSKPLSPSVVWLWLFVIFSYVVWQFYFSIARYLMPLEMLAPILIYLIIIHITKIVQLQNILLTMACYSIIFFMKPAITARLFWYQGSFFNVSLPSFVKEKNNAYVLMAYPAYGLELEPRPQFYLIPFFPTSWHFIGIPLQQNQYLMDKQTILKTRLLLQKAHSVFLLANDVSIPKLYQVAFEVYHLQKFGLCHFVQSDRQRVTLQNILLCPVQARIDHINKAKEKTSKYNLRAEN